MELVYRDNDIVVCVKPQRVLSTDEPGGVPDLVREALGDLKAEELGVEVLFATEKKGRLHIQERYEFTPVECVDGRAKYVATITPDRSGIYQVAGRIYAKNALLPHRQDFELVKWL